MVTTGVSAGTYPTPASLVVNAQGLVTSVSAGGSGSSGIVLQAVNMTIAEATGTTNIPDDDTLPVSTEGTEVGTQAITMADNTNQVLIHGAVQISAVDETSNGTVVVLFRGTTAIAARAGHSIVTGAQTNASVAFAVLDSPATSGSVTYSVRVGHRAAAGTGTWLVGSNAIGSNFGGTADDGLVLLEISAS